jgi:hypothetical protein
MSLVGFTMLSLGDRPAVSVSIPGPSRRSRTEVACPVCRAPVGDACVSKSGKRAHAHDARMKAGAR